MAEQQRGSGVPAALGSALASLTVGVGALRSVEPYELMGRAIVVGVVATYSIRFVHTMWTRRATSGSQQ